MVSKYGSMEYLNGKEMVNQPFSYTGIISAKFLAGPVLKGAISVRFASVVELYDVELAMIIIVAILAKHQLALLSRFQCFFFYFFAILRTRC